MVRLHWNAGYHSSHIRHHTFIFRGNERRNKWPSVGAGEHRCFFEHQFSFLSAFNISLIFPCLTSLHNWFLPGPTWSDKMNKAFFRGRDSREERLRLVTMSKENPELLDAGITAYFFFRDREKDLGKAPLVGFFDFFKVNQVMFISVGRFCNVQ